MIEVVKEFFTITEEWFNSNRDCIGGLNRPQAEALGEKYLLKKGWKQRIVGKQITTEQKIAYEDAKGLVYAVRKEINKQAKRKRVLASQKETLELELEVAKIRSKLKKLNRSN